MSLDTDERAGSAVSGKGDEPIDGLDGTVSVAPGQLFGSIYAFFYNKRVGLVLILLTGLFALIGVLFPQAPSGVLDDPASKQAWLESVRPTFGGWTDIMATLGFFSVFSSIPFVVLMVLLATISSTASTCRAAFMLRSTRVTSGVNCLSCNRAMASGQMPSSRLMRRLMELRFTPKARARRSLLTPRSMARRIM